MKPTRYCGTCELLCQVDASRIRAFVETVPFGQWPQQDRLDKGSPYPAMLTNRKLEGYYDSTQGVIDELLAFYPGCGAWERRLSVVVPGQRIFKHTDMQVDEWVVRIHVPILTNPQAVMFIEDEPFQMEVGGAYLVNTEKEHHLHNLGETPRIHFFFDVRSAP